MATSTGKRARSAVDGQFKKMSAAQRKPREHIIEAIEPRKPTKIPPPPKRKE